MFKVVTEEEVMNYADRIRAFEYGAGESFTDYFMDNNVYENSWAMWLNGYATATGNVNLIQRSNALISDVIRTSESGRHLCQHWKFDINSEPEWCWDIEHCEHICWGSDDIDDVENAYRQDHILWVRFLTSNQHYKTILDEYLTKFENGEAY